MSAFYLFITGDGTEIPASTKLTSDMKELLKEVKKSDLESKAAKLHVVLGPNLTKAQIWTAISLGIGAWG